MRPYWQPRPPRLARFRKRDQSKHVVHLVKDDLGVPADPALVHSNALPPDKVVLVSDVAEIGVSRYFPTLRAIVSPCAVYRCAGFSRDTP